MKKMEKLQKIARSFAKLYKGCFAVFGAVSVGIVILLFVSPLLGTVTDKAGKEIAHIDFLIGLVCCLAIFVCCVFIALHMYRLCRCIGEGASPFTSEISGEIRKLAFWKLIPSLIPIYHYSGIRLPGVVAGVTTSVILFCLSLIFEYGCELQKEVDETL